MAFKLKVTPEMEMLTDICVQNSKMDVSLYGKYDVKRGAEDINGKGVLAGLTQISNIVSSGRSRWKNAAVRRQTVLPGINIEDLTNGFLTEHRQGFEEVAYLLLFGVLPNGQQLADFNKILASQRSLPTNFVRDVVMKAPVKI